jgi:hypothetical protein
VHSIDDREKNGIIIHHNGDWSGEAIIYWTPDLQPPRGMTRYEEASVGGLDLLKGKLTVARGMCPPLAVATRVVALALKKHFSMRMVEIAESFEAGRY